MEKIEIISIDGTEVPDDLHDELMYHEISTHYADTVFRVYKETMPLVHAWLVEEEMCSEDDDRILCCLWGT